MTRRHPVHVSPTNRRRTPGAPNRLPRATTRSAGEIR